jgi:hypothetical protein
VGEWQAAAHASQQVVALSQGGHSNLPVLDQLVGAVELGRGLRPAEPGSDGEQPQGGQEQPQQPGSGADDDDEWPAVEPMGSAGVEAQALVPALARLELGPRPAAALEAGGAEAVEQEAGASVGREQAALERAVGSALKLVAGTASGDSALWELYAR